MSDRERAERVRLRQLFLVFIFFVAFRVSWFRVLD